MIRYLPLIAAVAVVAGCATPAKASYGRTNCESPWAPSPDGICSAYYKQEWGGGGGGASTLLIVSCPMDGYGLGLPVAGYGEHPERGVEVRWLSNDQLVAVMPPGVTLVHRERDPETFAPVEKPGPMMQADFSPARIVHISYREQIEADRDPGSCYAMRPKA